MAITTGGAIRDRIIVVIKALVPTIDVDVRFRPYRNEQEADFRAKCRAAAAGCERSYQVRSVGMGQPSDAANTDVTSKLITFDVVVAYPQSHRWGADAALERDDVIEADQTLIEHAIGRDGYGNFAGAFPNASWLGPGARGSQTFTSVERSRGVDFLVIRQTMRFYRSTTP